MPSIYLHVLEPTKDARRPLLDPFLFSLGTLWWGERSASSKSKCLEHVIRGSGLLLHPVRVIRLMFDECASVGGFSGFLSRRLWC